MSSLLANINQQEGYNLTLPASYAGPNFIYAISITPSGSASLVTYDSNYSAFHLPGAASTDRPALNARRRRLSASP